MYIYVHIYIGLHMLHLSTYICINIYLYLNTDIEEKKSDILKNVMTHDKNGRKIISEKTENNTENVNKKENINDTNDINNKDDSNENERNMRSITSLRLFSHDLLLRTYILDPNNESKNKDENRSHNSPSNTRETLPPLPDVLHPLYARAAAIFESVRKRTPRIILYIPSKNSAKNGENIPVSSMACKCTMMSNGPLPDLRVKWADGTKLKYSLSTGKTNIESPPEVLSEGLYPDNKSPQKPGIRGSGGSGGGLGSGRKNIALRGSCSGKKKKIRNDYGYHWEGDLFGFSAPYTPGVTLGDDMEYIPNAMKAYLKVAQSAIRRCLKELKNELSSPRHKDVITNSTTSPVHGANGKSLSGSLYSTSPVKGKGTGFGSGVWAGLGPKIVVDHL
jgi:hypothetical protein